MSAKITPRTVSALAAAGSGLLLPISGLLLHLARHTHAPRLEGWHFFMMSHIIISLVFTAAVVVHLVLNRRALKAHFSAVTGGR